MSIKYEIKMQSLFGKCEFDESTFIKQKERKRNIYKRMDLSFISITVT